jgi:hypothetical protein
MLQRIPFHPFYIDRAQFIFMPLYFIVAGTPFFCSGLAIGLLLSRGVSPLKNFAAPRPRLAGTERVQVKLNEWHSALAWFFGITLVPGEDILDACMPIEFVVRHTLCHLLAILYDIARSTTAFDAAAQANFVAFLHCLRDVTDGSSQLQR